ncbi:MAG: hypothetical protein Q9201_002746 [Fulgogasparrea decipioides]
MPSTNSSDIPNSPAGGSKAKKNKKRKGGGKGKPQEASTAFNGTKPEEDRDNEDYDGEDQDTSTPIEALGTSQDAQSQASRSEASNGKAVLNGVPSTSDEADEPPTDTRGEKLNGGEDEDETSGARGPKKGARVASSPRDQLEEGSPDDREVMLEALAQERTALRDEVAQLRRSLEEIKEKHDEDVSTIRGQLEERTSEKEHAETQYRNLLGKVNTIRSQLGERLKADAEDLAQARSRIEELEERCDSLRGQNEARTAELSAMAEEGEQRSKELSGLRNRTTLSQQNWAKEREDLVQREAMAREEFEAAKQAMQDWEILAIEERSVRESTAERVSDLEEQLSSLRDAYERAASERDSQSQTVEGLQRALQDIQDARRKELRDLVENSQTQVESLQKRLEEVQRQASEASQLLKTTQKDLERALPFEKEVKEKNLLIGKLRHEAVILNDHLTKALRYLKKGKPEENIDKQLVTNHFLHFLALERADPKKFQVLQIIAALLGWTDEQREQAGLARPGASNPNLRVPISPWHRTPSTPALSTEFSLDSSNRKESLAELWSDFLEQEAQEDDLEKPTTFVVSQMAKLFRSPYEYRAAVSSSEAPFPQSRARGQWTNNGDRSEFLSPPGISHLEYLYIDPSRIPVSNMATPNVTSSQSNPVMPKSHVGFDSITTQIERKLLKRGFQFNIICVGQTGLGKSTLINTIFASHLIDSKGRLTPAEPVRSTTEIQAVSHVIEENGVRLRLNIVDTPGYGDQVNNDRCWDPIVKYIKDQHSAYLRKELTAQRERYIQDTRVHCCLFFIQPSGHALKPIDIVVLKKLSDVVNVVPVIAKSDSLTLAERMAFKERIKEEFAFHNIRMYPYDNEEQDEEERAMNSSIKDLIPFAVVGSENSIVVNGRQVRGRQNRWGVINVEDENHCEFVSLRNFLTRTHLQDLIETTSQIHYETFRGKQLLALKENSATGHSGSRPISPSADRELSRQSQRVTMNGY